MLQNLYIIKVLKQKKQNLYNIKVLKQKKQGTGRWGGLLYLLQNLYKGDLVVTQITDEDEACKRFFFTENQKTNRKQVFLTLG